MDPQNAPASRDQASSPDLLATLQALAEPRLLATLLAAIPDGVVVTSPSSEILWANPAYCAMTGYSLGELIGQQPRVLRGATSPEAIRALWEALGSFGRFEGRLSNRRKDGSGFEAKLSIVRLPGVNGSPPRLLGIMRDVTAETEQSRRLAELVARADTSRDTVIAALASLAEQRDDCTGMHLERVERYCHAIARWIVDTAPGALPPWARDAALIARCAVLHDIGKVGIPDSILLKPGPLDRQEQDVMRTHPVVGARIIARLLEIQPESESLRIAHDIVLFHHERHDGEGYPYGISGDAVPMVAQIATASDVLDALTTRRPYKPPYPFDDALAWIAGQSGRMLNPLVVDALIAVQIELGAIHASSAPEEAASTPIEASGMRAPSGRPLKEERVTPLPSPSARLLEALAAARDAGGSGDLVVRHGPDASRVQLVDGRVGWIDTPIDGHPLAQLLADVGVRASEIRDASVNCKRTGRLLTEELEDRGLVAPSVLRGVVRRHLAEKLRALCSIAAPSTAFVPSTAPHWRVETYDIGELLRPQGG